MRDVYVLYDCVWFTQGFVSACVPIRVMRVFFYVRCLNMSRFNWRLTKLKIYFTDKVFFFALVCVCVWWTRCVLFWCVRDEHIIIRFCDRSILTWLADSRACVMDNKICCFNLNILVNFSDLILCRLCVESNEYTFSQKSE